jgi:hypothetical protein
MDTEKLFQYLNALTTCRTRKHLKHSASIARSFSCQAWWVTPIPATWEAIPGNTSQALVAHACNPSYSGDSDQEDHCSKSAWANNPQDSTLKKPIQNKVGGVVVVECLLSKCEA